MEKTAAIRVSNSFSPAQVDELLHAMDSRARDYSRSQLPAPKPFLKLQEKVNAMKKQLRRKQLEATRDAR